MTPEFTIPINTAACSYGADSVIKKMKVKYGRIVSVDMLNEPTDLVNTSLIGQRYDEWCLKAKSTAASDNAAFENNDAII